MKLLTYVQEGQNRLGIKTEGGVLDVSSAAESLGLTGIPRTMAEVVADTRAVERLAKVVEAASAAGGQYLLDESTLQFGPCLQNPEKILCVGQNYRAHVDEYTVGAFETPVLFSKFNNSLVGHQRTVELPYNSEQVDYEAELAVVIGKRASRVTEADALGHVFGFCNANDLSARDLQFRTVQWLLGKSPDGFCPLGPYVVTADEVGDPTNLDVKCYLNGELRQSSNTSLMIFNIPFLISYISQNITLEPGDVILTGTPAGTILGYPKEDQVWLRDGDVVAVEVTGLGRLENRMVQSTTGGRG